MKKPLLGLALACAAGIAGAVDPDIGMVTSVEARNDGTLLFSTDSEYDAAKCQNRDAPFMFRLAPKVTEATRAELIQRLDDYPLVRVVGTGTCVGGIEEVTVNFITPLG
jgi:hypothetical protein